MPAQDYSVQLEVFEGPLDLLLYLIKRDEIDIYDIPIEHVTKQYVEYLNLMRLLDLNIAGEFLVMSANLMLIKSRMLLPEDERAEMEEEEEDPRWDLVRQLVEYKKFKDAAGHLENLEVMQQNAFVREDDNVEFGKDANLALMDVSMFDLIAAFNEALNRTKEEDLKDIFREEYTVQEQVTWMLNRVTAGTDLKLNDVFKDMKSRSQIICTFLAVLELIRLKRIRVTQERMDDGHGEIHIKASEDEELASEMEEAALDEDSPEEETSDE